MDPDELRLLEHLRWRPTGLVVDDLEGAVGQQVEAVDDPPEPHVPDTRLEAELDADGCDLVGVLETEVVGHQRFGFGPELDSLLGLELQEEEVGV